MGRKKKTAALATAEAPDKPVEPPERDKEHADRGAIDLEIRLDGGRRLPNDAWVEVLGAEGGRIELRIFSALYPKFAETPQRSIVVW